MSTGRLLGGLAVTVLVLSACGEPEPAAESGALPAERQAGGGAVPAKSPAPVRATGGGAIAGRESELVDPDGVAMVLLYCSLAGLEPPLDQWARNDPRVTVAPPPDRPSVRDGIIAELEAGMALADDVGFLRFSVQTAVGHYDPTYGEFTIGALAPSSAIEFRNWDQKVAVRFGNARVAQLWSATAEEAELIADRFGRPFNARLDVFAAIRSVQTGTRGGTIVANVIDYELRENRTGALIARIDVPQE